MKWYVFSRDNEDAFFSSLNKTRYLLFMRVPAGLKIYKSDSKLQGAESNRLKYVECLLYLARTELKKENLDQAEYYANRCTQNELVRNVDLIDF